MSTPQHPEALRDARWYMLNKMGMATLCTSKKDAEKEARVMDMAWPHMGPHRAVQLVEAEDVEALRAGYEAARLEIESLRARCVEPAGEYPALPSNAFNIDPGSGGNINGYSADQMRAFADATHAIRAESLAAAYREELDKLSQRNYELRHAPHGQAPAQPAPAAVAEAVDLRARCEEILAWRKTGVLPGETLRTLARENYGDEYDAIQRAERDTETEALNFVIAAPTTQPAPQQEAQEPCPSCRNSDIYACTCTFPTSRNAEPQPSPAAQWDALDTMRLDWLDADDSRCVFHLGKSWYTRPSYGLPYRKRASLREAIDAAIDAARTAQEGK